MHDELPVSRHPIVPSIIRNCHAHFDLGIQPPSSSKMDKCYGSHRCFKAKGPTLVAFGVFKRLKNGTGELWWLED